MALSITDAVLEYQRSGRGLSDLIERVALIVYRFPRLRLGWGEDDCSDFFCEFFPKLPRLITRFQYRGTPFEVYLVVTLKWQLRTYAGRRATANLRARVLNQEDFWACEHHEPYKLDPSAHGDGAETELIEISKPVRAALKMDTTNRIGDPAYRRRLLLLALKSSIRLTDTLLEHVAFVTGYDPEWIRGLIEELKEKVELRRSRLKLLSERRNCCFFRLYCLQEQLRLVTEEAVRQELSRQMIEEGTRLSGMLDEIARVSINPTHRDIAEVLGIPKGTVDSAIYYLKERLGSLSL